eukprot:TRINITY_DN1394_c0_g1_i1.p1 TRINITY_DN1394_c0_g1~~TRINITY_DN1394_c0_g1_i1.p1  ORF type:complete len:310 (-),score=29.19 TRINITY_DN1394_c0_g1_i1:11-940(-)
MQKKENTDMHIVFFFSISSMTTIGYGSLYPESTISNSVVVIQSVVGLFFQALIAGFLFLKISRPSRMRGQVIWSDKAVINSNYFENETDLYYDEERFESYQDPDNLDKYNYLAFRLVNTRPAQLCAAKFRLLLKKIVFEETDLASNMEYLNSSLSHHENKTLPRGRAVKWDIWELDFKINKQIGRVNKLNASKPVLPLPWTIVHKINENSPLFNLTSKDWKKQSIEIIALLDGIDEATSHNVQARWSYTSSDVVWHAKFAPMVFLKNDKTIKRKTSLLPESNEGEGYYTELRNIRYTIDCSKLSSVVYC